MKISAIMLVTILMTLSGGAQLGTRRIPIMPVPPQYAAPDIPAGDRTPDFPLRVHIFTPRFGGASSTYQGYGSGNIDTTPAQGFDYTFLCSVPFVANEDSAESYEGRWKTKGFRLELLMGRAGSDHEDTCTLDIALKPKPFDPATPL